MKSPCAACAHSGIEPDDMDLTCHHPTVRAGGYPMGYHVRTIHRAPGCGEAAILFEQHPQRTPDGRLECLSEGKEP